MHVNVSHICMYILQLCDTYPRNIYVPTCAKHVQVIGSSKFRSRGRLPVLSYLHRDNQVSLLSPVVDRKVSTACVLPSTCLQLGLNFQDTVHCNKSLIFSELTQTNFTGIAVDHGM